MPDAATNSSKRAKYDVQLDRHEGKYIIPASLIPDIRAFIRPFCEVDPHGVGDPPKYTVTTLQLDDDRLSLHRAKEDEAVNRFKLRARTYGEPGSSPVFMEVKRKLRGTIVKSRTSVPFALWGPGLLFDPVVRLEFKSPKEAVGFYEFRRLVQEIGAEPVVLVRYVRESYFGAMDHYARVTFDTHLEYQPTHSWTSWGGGGRWFSMDTPLIQNVQHSFSGVVLELKTLSDAPQWMIDLVTEFGLERTGHCKYCNAVWMESLFCGASELPRHGAEALVW